ncbi:HAF repeat/PEP-CTERM domain-containing protein, partial [Myxococcota bacterium]|nr:HAF repeat/PEP-CTERM domain-containing protein [Myxococcota bacterium]
MAYAINSAAWIVGRAKVSNGQWRAFRRDPRGTMIDLGTLGGDYSGARAISEAGWVTGDSSSAQGHKRAFRLAPEPERALEELGTLGGLES